MAEDTSGSRVGTDMLRPEELSRMLRLPPRLQAQVRSRIRWLAVFGLLAYTASLVLLVGSVARNDGDLVTYRFVGLVLSWGLAAFMLAVVGRVAAATAVILVLILEVLACMLVTLGTPEAVIESGGYVPAVTWVTPIIIMFPLLIPTPPRWTLVAALASAATVPITLLLRAEFDPSWTADPAKIPFMAVSPLFAVVVAYFGSSLVYQLGLRAEKRRFAGPYFVEELIGRGGMGEVYRGVHSRLGRPAAIKFIHPEQLQARFGDVSVARVRFEREVEALSRIPSPHAVEIYDYDLDDQGRLFYAMELLNGRDGQDLVFEFGPLEPERAVYLLTQVCRCLDEAHRLGVVHRDIKPSNVMVCRFGQEADYVKVLDFGLMTPAGAESTPVSAEDAIEGSAARTDSGITQADLTMGTPDYMAPEQIRREPLDGRTDLYAVGGLAYWWLTGCFLYDETDPREKMRGHLERMPPKPSERTDRPIPPALEAIVMECLAKDPADRPGTAGELADRLAASVEARWGQDRARAWWTEALGQD